MKDEKLQIARERYLKENGWIYSDTLTCFHWIDINHLGLDFCLYKGVLSAGYHYGWYHPRVMDSKVVFNHAWSVQMKWSGLPECYNPDDLIRLPSGNGSEADLLVLEGWYLK